MQACWKIALTFAVLLLATDVWEDVAALAAENSDAITGTSGNPLRVQSPTTTVNSQRLLQLRSEILGTNRARAIIAIHELRKCGPEGAAVLAQFLKMPNQPTEVHFAILNSLTAMGPTAVPPLLELLDIPQSPENPGREMASLILGRLGAEANAATPTLIKLLKDSTANADDRLWAANLLGQMGPQADTAAFGALLDIAEQDQDEALRLATLQAMSRIGETTRDNKSRLVKLLLKEDESTSLRVAAGSILAAQPLIPQVVLPAIIGLAQESEDWDACIAIAKALGKFGPHATDAVPALIKLFEHEDREVRLAAFSACSQIGAGASQAIQPLIIQIQHNEDWYLVRSAAQTLIKIDPRSADALLDGLQADEQVRRQTLVALSAMGPAARTAVPRLLEMLTDPSQSDSHPAIILVLRSIGPDAAAAVPSLESRLSDKNEPVEIRFAAALTLGTISPATAPTLFAAVRDSEPLVRVAAAQALAIQNATQRVALPTLMLELVNDSNAEAADAAMQALVAVGMDAVPVLQNVILDEQADLAMREKACQILGRIGGEPSLGILVRVLQHPNEKLAGAAGEALLGFGQRAVPAVLDAIHERDRSASQADSPDPIVERMLELISTLSGGLGGGDGGPGAGAGSMFLPEFGPIPGPGSVGSAAPMAATPMADPTLSPPAAAADPPADSAKPPEPPDDDMPRPIAPSMGVRASGPMAPESSPGATPQPKQQLKVVKVFYGTNRSILSNSGQRWQFIGRGFVPALLMGGMTALFCLLGFAQTRSRMQIVLAVFGLIATIGLAYPAVQQTSNSLRSVAFRPGPVYGTDPGEHLELGTCEVSIPADHHVGKVESPSIFRLEFDQDPNKHVVLRDVTSCNADRFHEELKRNLAEKGHNILVFVHGYNVDFDNAARRTAQLACDLEFAGVPLVFSWPSQGNWYEYRKDEKQVELAVPFLKRFLADVVNRTQATSIHLVAHSMGNRALMTALKEMAIESQSKQIEFNQVILAAPDIDADIFRDRIASAIVTRAKRVTLYASSNDLALTASRTFNSGDVRAGDTSHGLVVTPGIETIDVSAVDTSLLGHSYYGNNPTVLTDLKELLATSHSAAQRPYLQAKPANNSRYWVFQHPMVAQQPANGELSR